MLGRLLGLRGSRISTLADWHPGITAGDADMESLLNELLKPSHPALRQICAVILSIPEGGNPTPEHNSRINTLAAEGRSQEIEKFLVETLVRLPLATAIWRANTGRTRWLKNALYNCLLSCAHLWAVPNREMAEIRLNADDSAAALRSMALLYHPDSAVSPGSEALTLALCRTAWRHRSPACLEAIKTLLEHVGRSQLHIKDVGYRLAEQIATITGQPRSSVAILAEADHEFGQRLAARRKVGAAAGDVLAPLLDALFDDPGHLAGYQAAKAAEHPAMAALLQRDAATLGAALLTLIKIVDSREQFGISAWSALSRRHGVFEFQHSSNSTAERGFKNIAALILRRKLALGDQDVAALVSAVPRHAGLQSRHMLNLAMKAAEAHPGGASERALRQLAQRQPGQNKAPLPAEWKADIDRLLAGAGAGEPDAAPLDLPKIDITSYQAVEQLAQHFANLFDRRLHDPRHTQFLAGLAAAAETLIRERQQVDPRALYARVTAPNLTPQERIAAHAQAVHHDVERMRGWIDRALATGAELLKQLSAVSPFVTRHGLVADRLDGLCLAIRNKSAPPQKWQDEGAKLMAALPEAERLGLLSTLIAATTPSPALGLENEHMLRGVIYLAARWDAASVAPLLTEFALRKCYLTEAGRGIKGEKLGNACLWTLIHLPDGAGVPYLARLLARVKYPKIRSKIDAALNEAAEKAGITRASLDELSVPSHGLNKSGETEFEVGGGRAVIALAGNRKVETRWYSPEGKQVKSPTAPMKEDKEALKEVKQAAKEIEADLATQIIRLQRLYLENIDWPAEIWRERYAEHPLLRALTSRLIWWVERDGRRTSALAQNGRLADVQGAVVELEGARIHLWHPIDDEAAAVMAWRDKIESLEIVQPFAQAWREIYRLADAERATGTYSNRWAGHILKQHQCMTLARINGWMVTHRMWVDAPNDAPWHRLLPAHGLVADYWVEGAGDRDSPDVLDSQAYVYVSTDRLKFCRIADPAAAKDSAYGPDRYQDVALQDVPAVVFSEIMRQCDLFTAVASIASDPEWRDRGADTAHPNQWRRDAEAYWFRSSFSDLSGSGATRRELLQRLIPRMAIADRCSFDDQALVISGKRHVYRIHLGSAAVQIAATRQHVCIVPKSEPANEKVLLPFEGDTTLSLILSKAFLLAADDKITDPVILRQL